MFEFDSAMVGYAKSMGVKDKQQAVTRNDFLDMVAEDESVNNGKT